VQLAADARFASAMADARLSQALQNAVAAEARKSGSGQQE
jgi:hypothetical protein